MKAFVFDMDGVVADTVASLYQAYLEFLRDLGKEGSPDEFDILNGPNLREVVACLKRTHRLEAEEEELRALYQRKMARAYQDVQLVDGVAIVLAAIKDHGYELALVSSAPREAIRAVLARHALGFDVVVSGDDVAEAKPAPAIYKEAARQLTGDILVVEDATNGIESALAAGLKVVAFRNGHDRATYHVESMGEVLDIVHGYRAFKGQVALEVVDVEQDATEADRVWEDQKNPNLSDRDMLAYLGHTLDRGTLTISCFISSYRFFMSGQISPLAVSGITVDGSGGILVAERWQVTEYSGRWELVPSGSLEDTDYERQVLKELEEEAGVVGGTVESLGLVHDIDHDVYDIACRVRVEHLHAAGGREYKKLKVVNDIGGMNLLPTSAAIRSLVRR